MPKKEVKRSGFWADVRELRDLIRLKLAQGEGTRALNEAMKQQIRDGAAHPEGVGDKKTVTDLRKINAPEALADVLKDVPEGQQLRMTTEEYRKLVGR